MELYECCSDFNYELKDVTAPQPKKNKNQELCAINFRFCAKLRLCDWILHEDSSHVEFSREYDEVVIHYLVSVSRNQFFFTDETRKLIQEELMGLHVSSDELRRLIEYASDKASEIFYLNYDLLLGYEVVDLHFDVFVEHDHVFQEISDSCHMVPAAVSAVKSLKRVAAASPVDCGRRSIMEETTSCSICLEEFSGSGGEEEVLSMPCSHVFHGNCIEKWLRTSHYCPLCRFEMPMEELDTEISISSFDIIY